MYNVGVPLNFHLYKIMERSAYFTCLTAVISLFKGHLFIYLFIYLFKSLFLGRIVDSIKVDRHREQAVNIQCSG